MSWQLRAGRWIPVAGFALGLVVFAAALVGDEPFPRAVIEGLLAAFGTMAVCGVATRFWAGSEVSKANLGTAGMEFAEAAEEPIRAVNERVDKQVSSVEERLYALEQESERRQRSDDVDKSQDQEQNQ